MDLAKGCAVILTVAVAVSAPGCEEQLPPLPPATMPAATGDQPSHSPPLPEAPTTGPHRGVLLPIDGGRGFVEWVPDANQVYYLDPQHKPLQGVRHATLHVAAEAGPRRVELEGCNDAAYAGACQTVAGDWLSESHPTHVLRFEVGGEHCRVLLARPVAASEPAGGLEPIPTGEEPARP